MPFIIGILAIVALIAGSMYFLGDVSTSPAQGTAASAKVTESAESPLPASNQINTNQPNTTSMQPSAQAIKSAQFNTNKGSFTIELTRDITPKTVENFVTLAQSGFYNGVKFHRIIDGFMIQGGDPLSKDDSKQAYWGTGGPGYTFADEITSSNKNNIGTISMANAGPNTNGSQFFINVANNNFLDTKHTVFGKVTQGMDVITAISKVQVGQSDRPVTPVVIQSIELK